MQKKWWVLLATGLASLLITIDFTIVNTALAAIQESLHATFSELQWMITSFGLTLCVFLITAGKLADHFGRKKIFIIGILLFGISSLGCAFAQTPWELISWRFVQGFGGAIILPCGLAITVICFGEEERGKAIGLLSAVFGLGYVLGPVLGGILVEWLSWKWIFLINVPILVISLIFTLLFIDESRKEVRVRIDYLGVAVLTLLLASFIFSFTEGPNLGWDNPYILGGIAAFICTFILFIWVERKEEFPLVPLDLFTNRAFLSATFLYCITLGCIMTILFLVPLYLQVVLHYSAAYVGLLLLPMTLTAALLPPIAGHLYDKIGARKLIFLAITCNLVGYILQLIFGIETPLLLMLLAFLLIGGGLGIGNGITNAIALSQTNVKENAALIAGVLRTLLNGYAVMSLTISGVIFRFAEARSLFRELQLENIPLSKANLASLRHILISSDAPDQLHNSFPPANAGRVVEIFRSSFVDGYHAAILFMLAISVVFAVIIFFLQKKKQ